MELGEVISNSRNGIGGQCAHSLTTSNKHLAQEKKNVLAPKFKTAVGKQGKTERNPVKGGDVWCLKILIAYLHAITDTVYYGSDSVLVEEN